MTLPSSMERAEASSDSYTIALMNPGSMLHQQNESIW